MLGFLLLVNKNKNKKTYAFPFLCTRKRKYETTQQVYYGEEFRKKGDFSEACNSAKKHFRRR